MTALSYPATCIGGTGADGGGVYTRSPFLPTASKDPYAYGRGNPALNADRISLFTFRSGPYDLAKLEQGKCNSSGFNWSLAWECDNATGCLKLEFTLSSIFTIRYDDYETYKHELQHVQMYEEYLLGAASTTLKPAEGKKYDTFFKCRDAALSARDKFYKAVDPFSFSQTLAHFWHDITDPSCH